MTIRIRCPQCGKSYGADESHLGRSAKCQSCGNKFTISPAAETQSGQAASTTSAPGGSAGRSDCLPPTIGPYTVTRRLGAGGMGEVWRGHDPYLDRDVAIKVLPAEFAQEEIRLQRFLQEARLAGKIHHTNVAAVYQAGVEDGRTFLAMELVEGISLDRAVSQDRPMPWREATHVLRDAAAGLAAAHELGLVHRDVKPSNLMRNTKGVTKLLDFGLARQDMRDTRLTRQGGILGTPAYMSPEQWIGKNADARSDLYSLICTYYYLLTARDPFDAPLAALGYLHAHEPLPDPRQFVPDLPDAVCRILLRGSQKKPEDRHQNAADLLAELDDLLAEFDETSLSVRSRKRQSPTGYAFAARAIDEIGRLIGGWLRQQGASP